MSKSRGHIESKENNWLDKHSAVYKEDEVNLSYPIDGLRYCIDSDSILEFDEKNGYIKESGKNREVNKIQKINKSFILKKRHINVTRRSNERKRTMG